MQEPKVGQLVTSRAGRDKNRRYLIVRLLEAPFVLVADGLVRGVRNPKKKNIKHLILHSKVAEEVSGCPVGELTDDLLRKALKRLEGLGVAE